MKRFIILLALSLCVAGAQTDTSPLVYENLAAPELPYASNYLEVSPAGYPAAQMHYLDTGNPEGGTLLLLHGQPTWSYLWRNVIPSLEAHARIVAPDLIGMGLSDKPDVGYNFIDHASYLEAFIEELDLTDVTLVIHDWGSALGFDYAYRHQDNVRAIAFMEALVAPVPSLEGVLPAFAEALTAFRDPVAGRDALINQNVFIEQLMQQLTNAPLSEEVLNAYRFPYPTPETREPLYQWPNQIPVAGEPADTHARVAAYSPWLFETEIPKLQLWVSPGLIGTEEVAVMLDEGMKNISTVYLGEGFHYVQESYPEAVGAAVAAWYQLISD